MGRASSHGLVAGPLTVARIRGNVAQAAPTCRTLGSGSETQAGLRGTYSIWQWQWQSVCIPRGVREHTISRWCLVAVPFSVPASEVTWASDDACLWTPSGGKPLPPLESEIAVVVCHCHL